MMAALILTPMVLWAALVAYGEDAPQYLWRWLWLPLMAASLITAKLTVLIGSLGAHTLTTYVDHA